MHRIVDQCNSNNSSGLEESIPLGWAMMTTKTHRAGYQWMSVDDR